MICKKIYCWVFGIVKKRGLTFIVGLIFAILCFIGINAAMKPVSTSQYCGSKCHEMKVAYQSWELSVHGANKYGIQVECVDCHLPPHEEYFRHIIAKGYVGAKDTYKHHFGGEYDIETIRKKVISHMTNDTCLHCHNNLLGKPGSSAAQIAHRASLNEPGKPENKCIKCHENAGHERQSKLFSP